MKIKHLILVVLIAAAVLIGGMITQGWVIGGIGWDDIKAKAFPTKQAFEKQRKGFVEKAEEAAGN